MLTFNNLSDWNSYYDTSARRFVDYYLAYARIHTQNFDVLAQELPNLRRGFAQAVYQEQTPLILEFWDCVSDFLWFQGHWELYSMWGNRGLETARSLGRRDKEAWVLTELGWLQMEQGEFETAGTLFGRSRSIFESIRDSRGLCVISRYLGVLAFRTEKIEQAEVFLAKALHIAEENDYLGMIAEIKNLQGSIARNRGNLDEARRAFSEAQKGFEATGDLLRLTAVLLNIGRLESETGNLVGAHQVLGKAITICQKVGRKDMLYGCQFRLAEVERQMGNSDVAQQLALSARDGFIQLGMKHDVRITDRFLRSLER